MELNEDYDSTHINYGVSVTDVLRHYIFAGCTQADPRLQDMRLLGRALHDLGMDTSYAVVSIPCTHRNMRNEVVNTLMFRGKERTDSGWLDSGYASDIAKDGARQQRKENARKAEQGMMGKK